jgi:ADP-L-glycero-D-manno-heptose 6-epimerase
MSKVLVTGASGFIGKNLLEHLISIDVDAKGLDKEYFESENWRLALRSELERTKPETIFHVGACSNTLETNVQYMMMLNYESTKIIADWCVESGSKLVYSSSAANYGETGLYPSNLYGWSKYVAEDYVVKSGGIALRYFNVYGPGEQAKGNMASFLYQAYVMRENGEDIGLFPGKPLRDFIYVKDVVSANLHAQANYAKLNGHYYEVSTGVASSFEQMLETLKLRYIYVDSALVPKGYQYYTCGDARKWMSDWTPIYSLEKGVLEYKKYLDCEVRNELRF